MSDSSSRIFASVPQLVNKKTYPEWVQRIRLALGAYRKRNYILATHVPPSLPATPTPAEILRLQNWVDDDFQVASLLLQTCSKDIISATTPLLEDPLVLSKSYAVFSKLQADYGTSSTQYKYTLCREFMDSKCGDSEGVGEWVAGVKAKLAELKTLGVDLDTLCVNVLLHGLPDRFVNLVDIVWTQTTPPTPDSVADQITTIDAGQKSRGSIPLDNNISSSAFIAHLQSLGISESDVHALAARSGKQPSARHPCLRCNSPDHWANKCPLPPSGPSNGNPPDKSSTKPPTKALVSDTYLMDEETAYALIEQGVTSFGEHVEFDF